MKFDFVAVLFTILIPACAGRSVVAPDSDRKPLQFSDVKSLSLGQVTLGEVIKRLGVPDQKVNLKDGKLAIIYYEKSDGEKFQRLGLIADPKTNIMLTSAWTVLKGENLSNIQTAKQYFHDSRFKKSERMIHSRDSVDEEISLNDSEAGISLGLSSSGDGGDRSVSVIGLSAPSVSQSIAHGN